MEQNEACCPCWLTTNVVALEYDFKISLFGLQENDKDVSFNHKSVTYAHTLVIYKNLTIKYVCGQLQMLVITDF